MLPWEAFMYPSIFILTNFLVSVADILKLLKYASYPGNYSLILSELSTFSFCWTYLLSFAVESLFFIKWSWNVCLHVQVGKLSVLQGQLYENTRKWSWKKENKMFHVMLLEDALLFVISQSNNNNNNQYIWYSPKLTTPDLQFSSALYKHCVIVKFGLRSYILLKACLYRWDLSNDLNLVRLLHVLICSGREFHVSGAAYLNDLTAIVLCLIFGISSIWPMVFDCMLSHVGFLMVMSSWGILKPPCWCI